MQTLLPWNHRKWVSASLTQPTPDAILKIAGALIANADMLFEKDERGSDEDLKLQFEAASLLNPEEKKIILSVIESMILRITMKEAVRRIFNGEPGGAS